LKEGATISILFPILAMGLPITDTAMAIFRRWVRNLPLSSADRRHVHHLLIGLGLNPRQAAALLYCFSAGLCGVVLIGVVYKNEFLAVVMGISGCLAFLLILTSRRDELATLRADFASRLARGKQERFAAKVTWEAIQRIELCETPTGIGDIMKAATAKLGCDLCSLDCRRNGRDAFQGAAITPEDGRETGPLSGPIATFRLSSGRDLLLIASLHQDADSTLAADIAFRFVQRLSLASAERLERLFSGAEESETGRGASKVARETPAGLVPTASINARVDPGLASGATALDLATPPSARRPMGWLREALGRSSSSVAPARSLGEE
jgi:UDP-GlcNAc:undecaprenyl-phosphate GlcNAc-1-phosphate transferase